jgi:hypothetical protein
MLHIYIEYEYGPTQMHDMSKTNYKPIKPKKASWSLNSISCIPISLNLMKVMLFKYLVRLVTPSQLFSTCHIVVCRCGLFF